MEFFALIILILFNIAGFAAIFFTTFGTLIILIGALLYAILTNFSILTVKSLVILTIFYLCGEVLENVLVIVGTKKFGASNAAIIGALFGGILGAIAGSAFLGVGVVLGAFLGIFLGAFLVELLIRKDIAKSLKVGVGGLLGRVGSVFAKVVIALIMFWIMISRIAQHRGV
ncbi:MAG: DUF456 domain-containing protein [Candidatus Omnitrophota bacterium]|nr:MAG: DUF456 domain-containing protein [Candidatus Omnitrophota bacterium]